MRIKVLVMLFMCMFVGSSIVQAQSYEQTPVLNAKDIVPKSVVKSDNYSIAPEVTAEGCFYHFSVETPFGLFTPDSFDMLKIRLREIEVISRYEELVKEDPFWKGVGESFDATGKGFEQIVTKPHKVIQDIPEGIGTFFSRLTDSIFEDDPREQKEGMMEGMFYADEKRALAIELGVDPYSTNKVLQEMLKAIASEKAWGKAIVDIGKALIPGAVGMVIGVADISTEMSQLLKDKTPAELRRMNKKKLKNMGIGDYIVNKFIQHCKYSPTQQTAITLMLGKMNRVKKRENYLAMALDVVSEEECVLMVETLAMFYAYHTKIRPLKEFVFLEGIAMAINTKKVLIGCASIDYIFWTKEIESYSQVPLLESNVSGYELWISGTISEKVRSEWNKLGYKVVDKAWESLQ